jgi:pyruvate ferredoxin oxidoreductase beta subunit
MRQVNYEIPAEEILSPGHLGCGGCGAALAMRLALKALGRRTVLVVPACCWSVIDGPAPFSAAGVPLMHTPFASAAASASGVRAALDLKGDTETTVCAWAGDGGTFDIGIQALSAAAERNENILYICYDNEAYMNTGVQRSSATPPAARTATTPAMGPEPGNVFGTGKSVPKIAVAHGIPYVATATVADLHDLERKVIKAMGIHGARYLHIHVPCPLGWGSASHDTIRLARLAVECGLFPVFEAEHGVVTASRKIRRRVPVDEYLKPQRRFAHLFATEEGRERIGRLQGLADHNIVEYRLLDEEGNA